MASWETGVKAPNESSVQGLHFRYNVKEQSVGYDNYPETLKDKAAYEQNGVSKQIENNQDDQSFLDLVNINYDVTVRIGPWWKGACLREKLTKHIIKDVSLRVVSGEVTAVLGNSGSGKTTLLDVIASKTTEKHRGKVMYNGNTLTSQIFKKHAGYVIQADRMLPDLTVSEVLTYTARLKFLDEKHDVSIDERVDHALGQMGMRHLGDSIVGGMVKRGISGGEKRRLSIATQLIQDPAIILLDEPTTGLDSFTAHNLIKTLSHLAKEQNKIVLLSIHQPRSDIFRLFDRIGILSLGEMVYYGHREKIVSHFAEAGYPCPTYSNPLDHCVDVSSIDNRSADTQIASTSRVTSLKECYKQSPVYTDMIDSLEGGVNRASSVNHKQASSNSQQSSCKFFQQTWILLSRMNVNIWRNKIGMFARFMTLCTFGLLCFLFLGRLGEDLTTIQDRTGLFFECISAAPLVGMLNAIALFPTMRDVYNRESGDGLYKTAPFLCAYYIHIIPFHIVATMIFSCITYWGPGLYPEASRFFIFVAVIGIIHYMGELITVLFLAIFSEVPLAQSVTTLTFAATSLLATGLLRTASELNVVINWIQYISFYKYATEILMVNEYQGLNFTCTDGDDRCDVIDGEAYLEIFFPNAVDNMVTNTIILCANVAAFWLLCIIGYSIRGHRNLY